jgi:hypothetical protein
LEVEEESLLQSVETSCFDTIVPSDCNFLCIYKNAIAIAPEATNIEVVSATVMYNLGLVNHGRGLQRSNSKLIKRACKLYRIALSVLMQSSLPCIGLAILSMALLNNLAHIYSYSYEMSSMNECLRCLRNTLDYVEQAEGDNEAYSVFLVNSICADKIAICAAAAA